MDLSLEKNKEIQIDHYHRCKSMPIDPQRQKSDQKSYETLKDFLPKEKGKVLDLGCGEANAYQVLAGHEYYGLDCCEEALEVAKKKVDDPDCLRFGMIEEIPFENDCFDMVWARHVLEHSCDIEKTLDEIIRVLKPDGLLIYAVPQGIHDEPAHRFQTDRQGWFDLLSKKFGMLKDGVNADPVLLNEYYGVCRNQKPKGGFYE